MENSLKNLAATSIFSVEKTAGKKFNQVRCAQIYADRYERSDQEGENKHRPGELAGIILTFHLYVAVNRYKQIGQKAYE